MDSQPPQLLHLKEEKQQYMITYVKLKINLLVSLLAINALHCWIDHLICCTQNLVYTRFMTTFLYTCIIPGQSLQRQVGSSESLAEDKGEEAEDNGEDNNEEVSNSSEE